MSLPADTPASIDRKHAELVLISVRTLADPLGMCPTQPELLPGDAAGMETPGAWVIMWHTGPRRWTTDVFGEVRTDASGFWLLDNLPPRTVFAEPIDEFALGLYPA